jgi:ADP-ribose pyrophosphatase
MSCERGGAREVAWEGKWLRMVRKGSWEYVERTNANGISVVNVAGTPAGELLLVEPTRVPIER